MAGSTVIVPKITGYAAYDPTAIAITGTTSTGIPVLLAQSYVAVSAPSDTTEDTLATIAVPAGTMASNGMLQIWTQWSYTNSANSKTLRVRFGGAGGTQYANLVVTTTANLFHLCYIANRGATNSQVGAANAASIIGATTGSLVTSSVDTTAATTIVITGQKALNTETLTLEGYTVQYVKASNA